MLSPKAKTAAPPPNLPPPPHDAVQPPKPPPPHDAVQPLEAVQVGGGAKGQKGGITRKIKKLAVTNRLKRRKRPTA